MCLKVPGLVKSFWAAQTFVALVLDTDVMITFQTRHQIRNLLDKQNQFVKVFLTRGVRYEIEHCAASNDLETKVEGEAALDLLR